MRRRSSSSRIHPLRVALLAKVPRPTASSAPPSPRTGRLLGISKQAAWEAVGKALAELAEETREQAARPNAPVRIPRSAVLAFGVVDDGRGAP
jgi:hypothetical protein